MGHRYEGGALCGGGTFRRLCSGNLGIGFAGVFGLLGSGRAMRRVSFILQLYYVSGMEQQTDLLIDHDGLQTPYSYAAEVTHQYLLSTLLG